MARYPQPGAVLLGKYCVESVIGEGGMGAVLKAMHLDLDEPVAIKVLLPDMLARPDIVRRFLREAKSAVKLKGEHVARVLDVGRLEDEFDGTPYIVMEYLEGADLNAIIKHHGAQDPPVAVDLTLQACEAIAEAHSVGVIHRDIKASNFFVTQPEGQAPHLKVLDFGIATAPEGTSDLTGTQSVIGTPAYMAPEQMRSSRQVDARSDIWSIGVVLYEMLEGKRPFRSEAYSDLCLKVGMDPPDPFEQPVPEALQLIVLKCLEKTVERRYQSVAELAFDLMPFASDPVLARASVEQCARMLGRRGYTRTFAAVRAPDDATPASMTPARLTPVSQQFATVDAPTPAPSNHSGSVPVVGSRRTLTPVPAAAIQKTPTSINRSNGEVEAKLPQLKPSRGKLMVGVAAAMVLVGVGVWVVARPGSGSGSETSPSQPAAAPAETTATPTETTATPAEPTATPADKTVKQPVQETPAPAPTPAIAPTPTITPTPTIAPVEPTVTPKPDKVESPKPPPVIVKKTPIKTPVKTAVVRTVVKTPPPPPKKDPVKKPTPTGDDDPYKRRQ
jgi:serine/threonine-protein kinase